MTVKYLSSQALRVSTFAQNLNTGLQCNKGSGKIQNSCSRLSRMRTDREAQGKAEGPREIQGALGWGIPMLFLGRQTDPGKE